MEILVYQQGVSKIQEHFTVADLPELLKDKSAVIWVDMELPTEEDERVLLEVFKFHPLTVEDCRENRHYPKIEEFDGYLYFIVHGVTANISPDRFNTIELDGFLGPNYVITYHHDSFRSINNVKQLLRTTPVACQRGTPFLLHQILDQVVDYYSPVLDDFDDRIDKLEADIFALKQPNNQILAEIMDLKRSVLRLRRISGKQMDILHRMSRGEFALIPEEMRPFYRDVYDHLVRVVDLSENYRDLISGSLEAYLSVVSNRLNEIMRMMAHTSLTSRFGSIISVPRFISSWYAMFIPIELSPGDEV